MFPKHSGVALLGSLSMLSTAPAARATDAIPAAAASPAVAADTLIPIESFLENCSFSDAILSPDGRSLAVRIAPAGQRVRAAKQARHLDIVMEYIHA